MQPTNKDQYATDLYKELYTISIDMLGHGSSGESIEAHLREKTDDILLITVVITEAKKNYYAQMRKEGNVFIGIGCIFILLGFLITFLNFHSNKSFDYAMYGFTSVGICLAFFGLYKIIG